MCKSQDRPATATCTRCNAQLCPKKANYKGVKHAEKEFFLPFSNRYPHFLAFSFAKKSGNRSKWSAELKIPFGFEAVELNGVRGFVRIDGKDRARTKDRMTDAIAHIERRIVERQINGEINVSTSLRNLVVQVVQVVHP